MKHRIIHKEVKESVRWVNIAKLIAIIAVMVDHVNGVLYSNQRIAFLSYFSVSLFILLMGVTSFWSYVKAKGIIGKKVYKRVKGLLLPYIISVVIYYIVAMHGFNLKDVIVHVFL